MIDRKIHKTLTYCIAAIWAINGFFCKVLNLVPRHEQIIANILGRTYAKPLTIVIGLAEMLMAIWILSGYRTKLNAIVQMVVIATMNILEFILVPELLLWGKLNSVFAFFLILTVYYNEFTLNKK